MCNKSFTRRFRMLIHMKRHGLEHPYAHSIPSDKNPQNVIEITPDKTQSIPLEKFQIEANTLKLDTKFPLGSDSGYGGSSQVGPSFTNPLSDHISVGALNLQTDIISSVQELEPSSGNSGNGDEDQSRLESDLNEIQSLITISDDTESQVPSRQTPNEQIAERGLWLFLAQQEALQPLCEEGLIKVGKARLVTNLAKLLKQYYLDLHPIAQTNLEKATVNLLRRKSRRTRIARHISEFLSPANDEDIDQRRQEKDEIQHKLQRLERYVTETMALVLTPPKQDEIQDDKENKLSEWDIIDENERRSDSSSDEGSEISEHKEIRALPNVDEMKNFLISSGGGTPFRKLEINLRLFLFPSSLGPLTRILMSIPSDRIWFSEKDNNFWCNRFKAFVEDATEDNWNWWPLQPRIRSLRRDQARVHWLCVGNMMYRKGWHH